MRIDRIFLVDIDLEKPIVRVAPIVLEPIPIMLSYVLTPLHVHVRVQFLEVGINEPLLGHLDEVAVALDEVALAFERAVIDLLDDLDGESDVVSVWRSVVGCNSGFFGVGGPGHEVAELRLVREDAILEGLDAGTAKD
jgi:hypothetical protein